MDELSDKAWNSLMLLACAYFSKMNAIVITSYVVRKKGKLGKADATLDFPLTTNVCSSL